MTKRSFRAFLLFPILTITSAATLAGTLNYEYDALGRLTNVQHADGSVVSYTLDPAGNRMEVAARTPPGIPASITVPASSSTGNYTVSWTAATGTLTAYEFYEATNSGFAGQTLVYSGTALSRAISGKGNGNYYYRVRACNGTACGGYRTGSNPTTVTPPGIPASITVPASSTTGSYTISWGWAASTGATRYELWENRFGGSFSKVYDGANTSKSFNSQPNGEYGYKAKACNAAGCSGYSPTRLVTVCVTQCAFAPPPSEE